MDVEFYKRNLMVGGNVRAVLVLRSRRFGLLCFSSSISYTPGLFTILLDAES
jgi:hypothetical protein